MKTPSYRLYVLLVLSGAYMVNFMDRPILILCLESIKGEMHLSDTQLGFLTGFSYAIFYAVLGIPFARWADRGNRSFIVALVMLLQGIAAGGFLVVATFAQLLLIRIAGAVGEAGCQPTTYSLLGDYFASSRERTRAMSVYLAGSYVAALMTYVTGGWLLETWGWRLTMALMAVPCILLALILHFTIKDPRTVGVQSPDERWGSRRDPPQLTEVLTDLWKIKSLRNLTCCLVLLYMLGHGLAPWYGAFLIRTHGLSAVELGITMGLIIGLGGLIGTLTGGFVGGGRWIKSERRQVEFCAILIVAMFPLYIGFLLLSGRFPALTSFFFVIVIFTSVFAPAYSIIQQLVANRARATTMAAIMLLANLIGMGMGPQLVGTLSDVFSANHLNHGLRYSMLTLAGVSLAAAHFMWQVRSTISNDLRRMNGNDESLLGAEQSHTDDASSFTEAISSARKA